MTSNPDNQAEINAVALKLRCKVHGCFEPGSKDNFELFVDGLARDFARAAIEALRPFRLAAEAKASEPMQALDYAANVLDNDEARGEFVRLLVEGADDSEPVVAFRAWCQRGGGPATPDGCEG